MNRRKENLAGANGTQQTKLKRTTLGAYGREYGVMDVLLANPDATPDPEIVEYMARLSPEQLKECFRIKRSAILEEIGNYNKDIGCSGCVRTLHICLNCSLPAQGLLHELFVEEGGYYRLRDNVQQLSRDGMGKLFTVFNNANHFQRKGQGRSKRCTLHTAHPKIDEDWLSVWDEMSPQLKKVIATLDVVLLSEALSEHLKDLYFCRDCRGNVHRALDLLLGLVDPDELSYDEEYSEEAFRPFTRLFDTDGPDKELYDEIKAKHRTSDRLGVREGKDCDTNELGSIDDVDVGYLPSMSEYEYQKPSLESVPESSGAHCELDNGKNELGTKKAACSSFKHTHQHQHHHDGHASHNHGCLPNSVEDDLYTENINEDDSHDEDGHSSFDDEDDDDFSGSEEYEYPATHIVCDLSDVPMLVIRSQEAEQRDELCKATGQSSDRHAPTLRDGQNEVLNCIGILLIYRIKKFWILQVTKAHGNELMTWVILNCIRTNIRSAVLVDEGNKALKFLLENDDLERESNGKRRNKKKNKKKNKDKKREEPTESLANELPEGDSVAQDSKDLAASIKWSEDSEARLLAQLTSGATEPAVINSNHDVDTTGAASITSKLDTGSSFGLIEPDSSDEEVEFGGEALTDEEIREAQKKLKELMANSSRAQLRANLREKFDNLCLKSS